MKQIIKLAVIYMIALSSFCSCQQDLEWDKHDHPFMLMSGVWDWEEADVYFKPITPTGPDGELVIDGELLATYEYNHSVRTLEIQDLPDKQSGLVGPWTVEHMKTLYNSQGKVIGGEFIIRSQLNPSTVIIFTR